VKNGFEKQLLKDTNISSKKLCFTLKGRNMPGRGWGECRSEMEKKHSQKICPEKRNWIKLLLCTSVHDTRG